MKRSTRHSLIMSALSLLLCASMLIGTTFAWFTDSVTSTGNIIKSGNLDVSLEYIEDASNDPQSAADTDWKDAAKGAIFNYSNWEPGFVQTRHIKIENEGNLALKYKVSVVPTGSTEQDGYKLSDVIDVYYIDPGKAITRADLDTLTPAGTLTNLLAGLDTTGTGTLRNQGDSVILTIALKMQESAGNEYQNKMIGEEFAVQLVATQVEHEDDSFDNTYDKNAVFPVVTGAYTDGTADKKLVVETEEGDVISVTVPAGSDAGNYSVVVDNKVVGETTDGFDTLSYDITLEKDGEKVEAQTGVEYPVEIKLDHLLSIKKLIHNGEEITNYDYDIITGIISFKTDSFSPFSVVFEELDIDGKISGDKIVGGYFETGDFNPADYKGENLVAEGYIAVEYTKNEKPCYVVNKADETVIVVPSDFAKLDEYKAKYGDAVKAVGSNGMAGVFSSLSSNDFNTVYIMPGRYVSDSVIYVYSSMDIIGLGNTKDIEIVKGVAGKKSNRHLFNCSGTKSDYIEVTIHNLYLNIATTMTNDGYDNGAVQSIRMSKVKCYDLIIDKDCTNWAAKIFYVNSHQKIPNTTTYYGDAYMYVENCVINTNKTNAIADYSTTYGAPKSYFYYDNITCKDVLYAKDASGSTYTIKNIALEADDWDW